MFDTIGFKAWEGVCVISNTLFEMVNEKNVKKAEERPETMWMIVIV